MNSTSAPENTSSYTVTGLDGINNYNVTVTSNYSEGTMMSTSDPVTVYGKNLLPHLIYTKCTYLYYECTYLYVHAKNKKFYIINKICIKIPCSERINLKH